MRKLILSIVGVYQHCRKYAYIKYYKALEWYKLRKSLWSIGRKQLRQDIERVLQDPPKPLGFNEYGNLIDDPAFQSIVAQYRAALVSNIATCSLYRKRQREAYISELRTLDRMVAMLNHLSVDRGADKETIIDEVQFPETN